MPIEKQYKNNNQGSVLKVVSKARYMRYKAPKYRVTNLEVPTTTSNNRYKDKNNPGSWILGETLPTQTHSARFFLEKKRAWKIHRTSISNSPQTRHVVSRWNS